MIFPQIVDIFLLFFFSLYSSHLAKPPSNLILVSVSFVFFSPFLSAFAYNQTDTRRPPTCDSGVRLDKCLGAFFSSEQCSSDLRCCIEQNIRAHNATHPLQKYMWSGSPLFCLPRFFWSHSFARQWGNLIGMRNKHENQMIPCVFCAIKWFLPMFGRNVNITKH